MRKIFLFIIVILLNFGLAFAADDLGKLLEKNYLALKNAQEQETSPFYRKMAIWVSGPGDPHLALC